MAIHEIEFPFGEIRKPSGDYFDNWQQARDAGYDDNQIWCVTEEDGTWCYDSQPHFVNFIGCIATEERHNGDTTYIEV